MSKRSRQAAAPPPAAPAPGWILPVLMAVYVVLTLLLIVRVPLNAAPDEFAHIKYVEHVAATGKLPVFEAHGPPNPGYEFHQPPLYYALCAPLWRAAPEGLQGHVCRLVSLICGAATLFLLWHSVVALFPENLALPMLATGFAALWPLHQGVGASAGNDALAGFISAAILGHIARAATRPWKAADAVILGVLAGLGLLTKMTCLASAVVAVAAAWSLARRETTAERGQSAALSAAIVMSAALLLGGWWLVRNQRLYGDPLAKAVFDRAFGADPSALLATGVRAGLIPLSQYLGALVLLLFLTGWGIFGGPETARQMINPFSGKMRPEAVAALVPMTLCAAAGLLALWGLVRWARTWPALPPAPRAALTWWIICLILVILAWAQFNMSYFQAQARYFHAALPPLALGFALGWQQILGRAGHGRALWIGSAIFAAALVGVTLWNAFGWRTLV